MSIEVFFATNRNPTGTEEQPTFGDFFHPLGPHYIRYGRAQLVAEDRSALEDDAKDGEKDSYLADRSVVIGRKYIVKSVKLENEEIYTPQQIEEAKSRGRELKNILGSDEAFSALQSGMKDEERDAIILIHGYACTFENALQNAAAIKERYLVKGKQCQVFVFSWPSDGKTTPIVAYHSDRQDAAASGVAIARAFLRLRDYLIKLARRDYCRQRIHLVAHSMGNHALSQAVQGIRSELGDGHIPRLLDHVFLMCADEDNDAFEHDSKLRQLPEMAQAVHVYFSPDDRALTISDLTKRNPDRLGSKGPRLGSNLPRNLTLVDCRSVDSTTLFDGNHQYYHRRLEVVEDVREVLAGIPAGEIKHRVWMPNEKSFRVVAAKDRKQKRKAAK